MIKPDGFRISLNQEHSHQMVCHAGLPETELVTTTKLKPRSRLQTVNLQASCSSALQRAMSWQGQNRYKERGFALYQMKSNTKIQCIPNGKTMHSKAIVLVYTPWTYTPQILPPHRTGSNTVWPRTTDRRLYYT